MKKIVCLLVLGWAYDCAADDLSIADGTQSVLIKPAEQPVEHVVASEVTKPPVAKAEAPVMVSPVAVVRSGPVGRVTYKNRKNVAPVAVPAMVGLQVKSQTTDACCNKLVTSTQADVEICAPACPTKQDVRTTRGGARKVYDYGRYEAVVTDKKNGDVEVRYRKRIFDR